MLQVECILKGGKKNLPCLLEVYFISMVKLRNLNLTIVNAKLELEVFCILSSDTDSKSKSTFLEL